MPAAAAPPAVSPPSSGVTIVDPGPPKPPPPPTATIRVSEMPKPASATPAPSKGSAMDRLRSDLAKKAKPAPEPPAAPSPAPPASPTEAGKSPSTPEDVPPSPSGETPPEETPTPSATPAAETEKGKKTNPWKLVEQYKGRLASMEKEIAEVKTGALGESQRKTYLDQIETLTKHTKELEDEIRFVNYSRHPEFIKKFDEPYQAAWKRATAELSEITVTDPQTQQARVASADDLLALCNLPLGKARELAESFFGNFADDVMAHRKEIRSLFDARNAALEEARTQGAEREKQQQELAAKKQTETAEVVKEVWDSANEAILKDEKYGRFFAPIEGDQEGNQRLAKGFELADKAFNESPMDPRLTPEQRALAVKRHVALRNRAAAFGRLVSMVNTLTAQNTKLAEELKQYKDSEPPAAGSAPAAGATVTSAKDAVFAALRAKAK